MSLLKGIEHGKERRRGYRPGYVGKWCDHCREARVMRERALVMLDIEEVHEVDTVKRPKIRPRKNARTLDIKGSGVN